MAWHVIIIRGEYPNAIPIALGLVFLLRMTLSVLIEQGLQQCNHEILLKFDYKELSVLCETTFVTLQLYLQLDPHILIDAPHRLSPDF